MTEQKQTCGVGGTLTQPCPHPAVAMMFGGTPACEGHKVLYELTPRTNELEVSIAYLGRWIRTAERCPDAEPLFERLVTIRNEFAAELAGLEAKEREIEERYSLPPSGLEQLEDKKRGEEDAPFSSPPESEAERQWQEFDGRASRFTAAASALEAEIDRLHVRLEELVPPLLEGEAQKAEEEAARVKEEFGL